MSDEKDFKVVDRRASSGATERAAEKTGAGFVMKDTKEAEPPTSAGPGQIDFPTLVFSLATGALINMGLTPDPVTQKTEKNLDLAKQNIDILSILKEKTKGNLTADEDKLLENITAEIQLRYVEVSKKKG